MVRARSYSARSALVCALLVAACQDAAEVGTAEQSLAWFATDRSGNGHHAELRSPIVVAGDGSATALELRGAAVALVPESIPLATSWEIEARFKWPFANGNTTT